MRRSVLAALGFVALSAAAAPGQTNNYWLGLPPTSVRAKPKPPPAPEIPDVPFAAAGDTQLAGLVTIPEEVKLAGAVAPIWLGTDAVGLPVTRGGHIGLMAFEGSRFSSLRVVADSSSVKDAAILDMAVSRDGKRVAIAADAGEQLQIWIRSTEGSAPASMVKAIDANCRKAGISWLDGSTLAIGAQTEPQASSAGSPLITTGQESPETPPPPAHSIYIVQLGEQPSMAPLGIECLDSIDPAALIWSPDGHLAVARSGEHGTWTLIEREQARCTVISLPGVVAEQFLDWQGNSRGFLFTAAPRMSPDPAHIGVMEYTVARHKARLLASPATSAAYAGEGKIAVLGSQRLNAAAIASNPDTLFPAEIAWIDPGQSQMDIVPAGFSCTAAQLLRGYLAGSASGLVAASLQVPHPKGAFTALLWLSADGHRGGVLGTGRIGAMVARWSPDSTKLAVLAGLPDHPTLAIINAPQQQN